MKKLKKGILKLSFVIGFLICSLSLFAQPPGGPPPGGGGSTGTTPPCWEPQCVPIDGGLGFLLVAGIAFGARKIYGQVK